MTSARKEGTRSMTTISRPDGRCTPQNTTAALVRKILEDNPALARELRHRHTFNRKRLMTRLGPHLNGIETASDWLLETVRFAERPTLDSAVVRDAYQAATGNRIEILDFRPGRVRGRLPGVRP